MKRMQSLKLHIIKYFSDGILNFLLITGMLCGFLSAFGITYHGWIVYPVLFLLSLACACIYRCNSFQRLLFYMGILLLFFALIVNYDVYINAGFYIIVNEVVDEFSTFLNVTTYQEYHILVDAQKEAVSLVLICFSFLFLPLINIFAAEKKNIVGTFLSTMPLLFIPLYIHAEPAVQWQAALICGYVLVLFGRYMKHAKQTYAPKKFCLLKLTFYGMAYMALLLCLIIIHVVFPQNYYDSTYKENKYKTAGYDTVRTLLVFGLSGFFNDYEAVGGMNGGKLGGISSVRPDYETDLIVEFVPYSDETLYLKGFTGITYTGNQWIDVRDTSYYLWQDDTAYYNLKLSYILGDANASKALLRLRNVGASIQYDYVPYYSQFEVFDEDIYLDEYCEYEFYPYHELTDVTYPEEPDDIYLEVPEENAKVINKIIKQQQLTGDTDEIVAALQEYFAENFTYTLSPGKTHAKADFVNYFLTESRQGYCAHFASAAVLLLRSCGIPARYVEGYALHSYDMTDGTLQNNLDYDDFYDGYNELGSTGVIRCEINDSQAHAWVEYWDEDFGWRVAEFTPPSDGADDYSDFWTRFTSMLDNSTLAGNSQLVNSALETSDNMLDNPAIQQGIARGIAILRMMFLTVAVFFLCYRILVFQKRYYSLDKPGNLIRLYSQICRLARRKVPAFSSCYSHREQLERICRYLFSKESDSQKAEHYTALSGTLEQLSYTARPWQELMSEKEYRQYRRQLFTLWRRLYISRRRCN